MEKDKKGGVRNLDWNDLTEKQRLYSLKMIKLYLTYIKKKENKRLA